MLRRIFGHAGSRSGKKDHAKRSLERLAQAASESLRRSGNVTAAITLLEDALQDYPQSVPLLKSLAVARHEAEDHAMAIDLLDRVKAIEPLGEHSAQIYEKSRTALLRFPHEGLAKLHYFTDPEAPSRQTADELVGTLARHDAISFDIFDTAIVRAVSRPLHVFRIMGLLLNVTDFTKKRMQAEAHARTWNDRLKGTREVTLDDIYSVLAERHSDIEGWKELEIDLELRLTRPNPFIRSAYDRLKAMGKRLVFTSDMYLPREVIEDMLARAGYSGHETIFLSNEHAARKGDGTLQAIVARHFGPGISVAHVGDVFDADVRLSNEAGLTGVFNPDQRIFKREPDPASLADGFREAVIDNAMGTGLWEDGLHYTHGFRVGGILALGYIEFLERVARQKGADRILFLGRDCYVLSQIYNRFFASLPSSYVETARVAALTLTAGQNFHDYIMRTFFRWFHESNNSRPLRQLLEETGFGYLTGELEQADIEPLQFPASANEQRLQDFFWSRKDLIIAHLSETRQIADAYLAEAIGDAQTVLAVDIGWTGSCITMLRDFLRSTRGDKAPAVAGALMVTSRNEQISDAVSDGSISAFVYSPLENLEIAREVMPGGNVPRQKKDILTHAVEYLFTETVASTVGYGRDAEGRPVPVRGANVPANPEQIREMQRGMIDFVERYLDYSAGLHHLRRIGPYTAFQPLRNALGQRPYLHAVYKDFLYDAVSAVQGPAAEITRFGELFDLQDQMVSARATGDQGRVPGSAATGAPGILFVSPEMKYVGAPRSLLRLCNVAVDLGYAPIVWTERPGPFSREFEARGLKVETVAPGEITAAMIEDLRKRNVVLAVCNTIMTDRFVTALEGKVPVVWYVREATNVPQFLRGNPDRAETLRRSRSLAVVSDYAATALGAFTGGRVEVVRNAVEDVSDLALPYEPKRDGIVRFLQLGTVEHRKGYDVLVLAFQAMPESYRSRAELHFAGGFINSATGFASYLFGLIGDDPRIRFHGLISDNRHKIELMSRMDVVVVASRDESCSLVALEGAMLSKPLIVTQNVGAKYVVDAANGHVVATGDVAALRDAMMAMIDQSAQDLGVMGRASRSKYEAMGSMKAHRQDLEALFSRRIAAGPMAPLPAGKVAAAPALSQDLREVIVSLTSFPPRMSTLATCIRSLKGQAHRPDRILLWLSSDQFAQSQAEVPESIQELVDEQFMIRWVDEDLGPHKKYFHAMQDSGDALVVTVDDDVQYDRHLIAALLEGHRDRPHCIIAGRSNLIRFRPNGELRTYDHWGYDHQHMRETETYALLPTGIGGVLYPPGALPAETFDAATIRKTCLHADDLWLKAVATANGTPVWMPRQRFAYDTIPGSQRAALFRDNAFRSGNDAAMRAIIDHMDATHGIGRAILRRIRGLRDDGTWIGPGDDVPRTGLWSNRPDRS